MGRFFAVCKASTWFLKRMVLNIEVFLWYTFKRAQVGLVRLKRHEVFSWPVYKTMARRKRYRKL